MLRLKRPIRRHRYYLSSRRRSGREPQTVQNLDGVIHRRLRDIVAKQNPHDEDPAPVPELVEACRSAYRWAGPNGAPGKLMIFTAFRHEIQIWVGVNDFRNQISASAGPRA